MATKRPSITQLGRDLLAVSPLRRAFSLVQPFVAIASYLVFALLGWWPAAIAATVWLSFVTYGSISHDLVHRNIGLPARVNDLLLRVIEGMALRSGTAYRLAHLHHHATYPDESDVEGAAASMSLVGSLVEGVRFQTKLFIWAWRARPDRRSALAMEGTLIALAYIASMAAIPVTLVPIVYVALMTAGAWIIPLITSYIPHTPEGPDELHQTRLFRGVLFDVLAFRHLYHLEHHLYPSVPHHNWPELARRLDPYFDEAGLRPIRSLTGR